LLCLNARLRFSLAPTLMNLAAHSAVANDLKDFYERAHTRNTALQAAQFQRDALVEAWPQAGATAFLAGPIPIPLDDIQDITLIGRQVGPYVIEVETGRGGMGSVWRARRADGIDRISACSGKVTAVKVRCVRSGIDG
jgi:hypothetical protein